MLATNINWKTTCYLPASFRDAAILARDICTQTRTVYNYENFIASYKTKKSDQYSLNEATCYNHTWQSQQKSIQRGWNMFTLIRFEFYVVFSFFSLPSNYTYIHSKFVISFYCFFFCLFHSLHLPLFTKFLSTQEKYLQTQHAFNFSLKTRTYTQSICIQKVFQVDWAHMDYLQMSYLLPTICNYAHGRSAALILKKFFSFSFNIFVKY